MAKPIYKVWMANFKDAFYKLSPEEQEKLMAKGAEALKAVGGETVVFCSSGWCSENYLYWGVEKFPDIEAVQKYSQMELELNWYNYFECTSYLGTEGLGE